MGQGLTVAPFRYSTDGMKRQPAICLCVFLLIGFVARVPAQTAPQSQSAASATPTITVAPGSAAAPQELTGDEQDKRIYYFEHRFIPKFVHDSEGRFFDDLIHHDGSVLKQAAAKIVGESFAAQLKITTIEPGKAALITFAPPTRMPQCYYAIVAKTDSGYAYITLEKAMDLAESGTVKAMYCGWSADGVHQNFGPRSYDTAADFVKEFLSGPATAQKTPQASFRPAAN